MYNKNKQKQKKTNSNFQLISIFRRCDLRRKNFE